MSEATAPWDADRPPRAVCMDFRLGKEARALLKDDMSSGQFLDALAAGGFLVDACRFLAHALPRRKAVAWACACLRSLGDPEPESEAGLAAAERWLQNPSEDYRRAALAAAEAAEVGAPGGLVALAAGVSGGSLAPPHAPTVVPGTSETARAVAGVVLLAAVQSEPERAPEKLGQFLTLGKEIAGRSVPPVPEPRPLPPPAGDEPTRFQSDLEGSVSSHWVEDDANAPSIPPPRPRQEERWADL